MLQKKSKVSGGVKPHEKSKISRGAMLLQTLQGTNEPGGTQLELPRQRQPGFLALLNWNAVLQPEVPENHELYSVDNAVIWTFERCG